MERYRAEVIGSMLRPPELLEARDGYRNGRISAQEFKRAEDRAVDVCIAIQERAGVDVVADGEQRRNVFASQLVQASEGFEMFGNPVDWFTLDGRVDDPVTVAVVGKIKRKRHLSAEEFVYLRADHPSDQDHDSQSDDVCVLLGPGHLRSRLSVDRRVPGRVSDILRDEVAELVRLGADYIQSMLPSSGCFSIRTSGNGSRARGSIRIA